MITTDLKLVGCVIDNSLGILGKNKSGSKPSEA